MIELNQLAPGGILVLLILAVSSCGGQNGSQEQGSSPMEENVQKSQGQPVIVFDTLVHNFGTIIEGERVVRLTIRANVNNSV